jgi:hypothetical protein
MEEKPEILIDLSNPGPAVLNISPEDLKALLDTPFLMKDFNGRIASVTPVVFTDSNFNPDKD